MDSTVLVALLGFAGSLLGTLGGIIVSARLTNYRLEQLEKKVEKHNGVIERTFKLEEAEHFIEEKIENIDHRIDTLEEFHRH